MAQKTAFLTLSPWGRDTSISAIKEAEPTRMCSPRISADSPPPSWRWKPLHREHEMEKVLFACDELTGLIGAAALMRPSKSCTDMELKSLKKKFKDKKFAAGCSREVIAQGADLLGWELDKLLDMTLQAMQDTEAAVQAQLT